jgi:two-component system, NarL family, response regulator NreC
VSHRMEIHGILNKRSIRCVLFHQHILMRQGLSRLLEDEPGIEVVGEAGDTMECLRIIREFQPDVIIADASGFGLSTLEARMLLERESSSAKVVFLNTTEKKPSAAGNSMGGAEPSASPQTSVQELVGMVRRVCGYDDPPEATAPERRQSAVLQMPERSLTAREQEVLKLLAEGKTVRAAASDLGLSSKTVDAHKFNLMRKLGIHNKADLVMWAIQKKFVKIPANL